MLAQHGGLYRLIKAVKNSSEFESLTNVQKKILDDALREFQLSGADLDDIQKLEFRARCNELASLQAKFEENILDATRAWSIHIDDGARAAVVEKGTSLLAAGIVSVDGGFEAGEAITIQDSAGRGIARGLTNYSCPDLDCQHLLT